MSDTVYISHIGTKRHSGRYPWGSGGDTLSQAATKLRKEGLSQKEIAVALGFDSTTELRNQKAVYSARDKADMVSKVSRMREGGQSVASISRELKIAPSTVRDLLKPNADLKWKIITDITNKLKEMVKKYTFVDIGEGTEARMEVSRTKLDNGITHLKNQGYEVFTLKQEQLGSPGQKTTILVLAKPGTTFKELVANKAQIAVPNFYQKEGKIMEFTPAQINNMSSKKVLVKYADNGGGDKDGLIELRAGVKELNLGGKAYAQVRIGVDGTHFMKGMAIIRDDMPPGVDVIYNTSKQPSPNKLDAMKEQKEIGPSKFGAVVKPNMFISSDGKPMEGHLHIVGDNGSPSEEGNWSTWKKTLASQVLSKQNPALAKEQLDIIRKNYEAELDDILTLTHPVVKNHLLMEYADKVDRSSVELKAAALPRQTNNVLLPDPDLKPNEIYAPNYDNGEVVSLVRYPHGGVFEVPTLVVNNKTSEYRKLIGPNAPDAVAIHPDVAQKLSGADFDGDTALVIPNRSGKLRTEPQLEQLKNFDPKTTYPKYDGMKVMSEPEKQRNMGVVSNLITDMTIKGASNSEIARAVRHSMVVIDAHKHELNYKQSEIDNGIKALKDKYQNQGGRKRGASTLISKTTSEERVLKRRNHYDIDPETGKKIFTNSNDVYIHKKTGAETPRYQRSTKGYEADDAHTLSSGTRIEKVYADHSNKLKVLANKARLETLKQAPKVNRSKAKNAKIAFAKEVESLERKHKASLKARPLERKAQLVGDVFYNEKRKANPTMSFREKTKWKGKSINVARSRLKSSKPTIDITPREWNAIEAGAVSRTRLKSLLRDADMDQVRTYATPRGKTPGIQGAKKTRAMALQRGGYTNAEIAAALGVPVSQVQNMDK